MTDEAAKKRAQLEEKVADLIRDINADLLNEGEMQDEAPEPKAQWDDPFVQAVYEMLCSNELPPNEEEHWEGWLSCRIADLAAAQARAAWEAGRDAAANEADTWEFEAPVADAIRALQPPSEFQAPDYAAQARAAWEAGRDAAVKFCRAMQKKSEFAAKAFREISDDDSSRAYDDREGAFDDAADGIAALQPPSEFQLPPPPPTPTSPPTGPLRGAVSVSEAMVERLTAELNRFQFELGVSDVRAALEAALNGEGPLRGAEAVLHEALTFYATEKNWRRREDCDLTPAELDDGRVARAALEDLRGAVSVSERLATGRDLVSAMVALGDPIDRSPKITNCKIRFTGKGGFTGDEPSTGEETEAMVERVASAIVPLIMEVERTAAGGANSTLKSTDIARAAIEAALNGED